MCASSATRNDYTHDAAERIRVVGLSSMALDRAIDALWKDNRKKLEGECRSLLSVQDRFEILEQLNLHQRLIDRGWGKENAQAYVDLYWPEGKIQCR